MAVYSKKRKGRQQRCEWHFISHNHFLFELFLKCVRGLCIITNLLMQIGSPLHPPLLFRLNLKLRQNHLCSTAWSFLWWKILFVHIQPPCVLLPQPLLAFYSAGLKASSGSSTPFSALLWVWQLPSSSQHTRSNPAPISPPSSSSMCIFQAQTHATIKPILWVTFFYLDDRRFLCSCFSSNYQMPCRKSPKDLWISILDIERTLQFFWYIALVVQKVHFSVHQATCFRLIHPVFWVICFYQQYQQQSGAPVGFRLC